MIHRFRVSVVTFTAKFRAKRAWAAVYLLLGIYAVAVSGCRDAGKPAESTQTKSPLESIPGFDPKSFAGREGALMELVDPASDEQAWSSEAFSAEVSRQLKSLAKLLQHPDELTAETLSEIVDADFSAASLVPAHRKEIFRNELSTVSRGEAEEDGEMTADAVALFQALMQPHAGASEIHVKLKNYRIEYVSGAITTAALFQSSGRQENGITQQNAEWTCRWTDASPPLLSGLSSTGYERVEPGSAGGVEFVDATGAVLGGVPSFREQMTVGAGHWSNRLQKFYGIDTTAHQGIAIGDADGDGLDDIYVAQQGGFPNRLYVQNLDGTLRDVSAEAGVDWMELTHGVLFADLDNDGDQDLVIAQSLQVLVMENLGGLKFETRFRGGTAANYFSVSAVDYDGDGDLDLYACGYSPRDAEEYADGARVTVPLPYHDSRNGGPNILLRNDGAWAFADATAESGLGENNDRHSFAASWEDYDNDGDQDVYVANDFGRNNLYQNQGRGADGRVTFRDVAAAAGVEDMSAGMSVTWGDYNRDGLMDLYVSNMFSAAGNRVTYQRQFRPGADTEILAGFRRHARGNSLFQNNGDGTFSDVSVEAGVTMGRWAWGAQFADLNNDGWEDLYVANGYISSDSKDDL